MSSNLIIIEPWEFGTLNGEGPFNVELTKGIACNWLITFPRPIIYKGSFTKYLLGKPSSRYKNVDLVNGLIDKVPLEIAFIENLDIGNFMEYNLDNYRGQFLKGELKQ